MNSIKLLANSVGQEAYYVAGDRYTLLASGAETEGQFVLFDGLIGPGGGPPPHTHARESESFYVLEGRVSFFDGVKWSVAEPGAFVHVPRLQQHAFRNDMASPARMLIQAAPAGLELFFAEVGKRVSDFNAPPPAMTDEDIRKLIETAPRYGMEIKLPQ